MQSIFLLLTIKTIVVNVVLAYGSHKQLLNMETQNKHCVSKNHTTKFG
jgi:hypothetical protein